MGDERSRDRRWGPGHSQAGLSPDRILDGIGLTAGHTLLDAGCGEGRFSIPAAAVVGSKGKVYAADSSEERIEALRRAARAEGLDQIEAFVADIEERLPVPSGVVHVCLMANVFHELVENGAVRGELREIRRVLRPDGELAILDFRKDVERPPGPPTSRRVDSWEVKRLVAQCGFRQRRSDELGSYHYLSVFEQDDTAVTR